MLHHKSCISMRDFSVSAKDLQVYRKRNSNVETV